MGVFLIEVSAGFRAGHQLRLSERLGGGVEPLHEHDWKVTVRVADISGTLDDMQTVTDFHLVEKILHEVVGPWEGKNLNDIPPFDVEVNPTAERVAERIGEQVNKWLKGVKAVEVRVTEAPGCVAVWRR